jgi:hypothetical protein
VHVYPLSIDLFQNVLLSAKSVVDMTQRVACNALSFASAHVADVASLSYKVQKSLLRMVAHVEMSDANPGEYVKATIHFTRDALEWVSTNYRDIKETFLTIPLALGDQIDADINELMVGVAKHLKQFKAVSDVLTFYMEYRSWFEEVHFTSHMQKSFNDFTRFVCCHKRSFLNRTV